METVFNKKLNLMFTTTMVLVGMVLGFVVLAPYAVPRQQKQSDHTPGALTYQSVCTTCHQPDRVQNYQGSQSWPEVIDLMRSFGAFVSDEGAKEIADYLEATYPRQ